MNQKLPQRVFDFRALISSLLGKVFPLCCFAVISLRINSLNLDRERVEGGSRVENLWLEAGVTRSVHQIED